jgi:hypothetical protein
MALTASSALIELQDIRLAYRTAFEQETPACDKALLHPRTIHQGSFLKGNLLLM